MRKHSIFLLISFLFLLNGCGGGSANQPVESSTPASTSLSTTSDSNSSLETTVDEPETMLPECAMHFTSAETVRIEENRVSVLSVTVDSNATVSYGIAEGKDGIQFIIDKDRGNLAFTLPPDFEDPKDSDRDNHYEVIVTAVDTTSEQIEQSIYVSVTDVNELHENDADGDYIPNDIEIVIGTNPNNADENNNGTDDGLETEGVHGDTFFDKLWHIRSLGSYTNDSSVLTIIGNDLDLLEVYHSYMGYNKGNPIIVQVVDTGVDADHEDLLNNMDFSRSYKGENVGNPSGRNPHGTMVAGIMAARAFNGKGVRGIIPFAKIAGSNWLEDQSIEALTKAWLTGDGANEIAVSNNSWGTDFDTDTEYEDIMELGTRTLRDGKGRIYLFAAGNERENHGNANLQYILSNRFSIAVASLKHDNRYSDYSSPGANILVSGYGGNYYDDTPTIGTTTMMGDSSNTGDINAKTTWSEDVNGNYTYMMNATSASSPMVAASVALVLEACPTLTWRDMKYLIATQAKQVDPSNQTWITNSAGLKHSIDYGFGLINTKGMIDACSLDYVNLPTEQNTVMQKTFDSVIEDNNTTHSFTVNITQSMNVEWVEVTVDSNHTNASDFRVELISPQSTKTTLITQGVKVSGAWMSGGFRLSTPAMINEQSDGNWTIEMRDTKAGVVGGVKNIELKIYGH